jgi:hypothetical protein
MERMPVDLLIKQFPAVREILKDIDPELMDDMQNLHDAYDPTVWKDQAKFIAIKHYLIYTP